MFSIIFLSIVSLSVCKYNDFFQDFQIFLRETYEGGTSLHHEFELRSSLLTLGRVDASITLHSLTCSLGRMYLTLDVTHMLLELHSFIPGVEVHITATLTMQAYNTVISVTGPVQKFHIANASSTTQMTLTPRSR